MNNRTISHIIKPQLVIEGAGVLLRRSVSPRASNEYDPFLLFDHFAFNNPQEGPIRGFPMHPHRGIETVTYMLDGSVSHRDSLGNAGVIGAGDVQWMTSGRGIMHEEMPRRGESGNIYGFQLWVNLPAAQKMDQPRYQEVNSSSIPIIKKDGATIRLVAGELDGVNGPVTEIAAAPLYMDVKLDPASRFIYPIPSGHTTLAYVFEGAAEFGGQIVESVSMVVFNDDGGQIDFKSATGVQFMLISGAPFGEPIVPYGPFVMNTAEEIQQAIQDLRNGTFVK
ncbi:MAG: pirin family protein [Chloroflexi bacterium]|nr:pirin family protein [Chloroflexota bacterium]